MGGQAEVLLLLCIAIALAIWIVVSNSVGKLPFWRAVHKHPVLAIMWMAFDEESWEFGETRPGEGYSGPFRIVDPFNESTVVWGRELTFERSQDQFLRLAAAVGVGQELFMSSRFYSQTCYAYMMSFSMTESSAASFWRARVAAILGEEHSSLLRELGLDRNRGSDESPSIQAVEARDNEP